jgi:hypothetical protein
MHVHLHAGVYAHIHVYLPTHLTAKDRLTDAKHEFLFGGILIVIKLAEKHSAWSHLSPENIVINKRKPPKVRFPWHFILNDR